jgi:anaerobic selenocysteine-containing dehydrogenase
MFATVRPSCYFTWVGLEQHSDAIQTNRAVCTFYALTGQFDHEGSNVVPAGAPMNPIAGQGLLPRDKASRRLGLDERPLGPPGDPGIVQAYRVYPAILTGEPYPIKALVAFGSDPILANGDPLQGKAALEALDFYVHVDMFANPSASFADMLLPATTCWESEALLLDAAVRLRPAIVQPQGESRSDLEIIFDLAARLGLGEYFFGGNIEDAFNYQLEPSGITVEQLRRRPMGIRAGAPTRYEKYAEIDALTGRPQGFATPTRKIEIYSTTFARAGYPPLPVFEEPAVTPRRGPDLAEEYPLVLTFSRLVQFCDEQHRNIPRLRRQAPDPFVEIHPDTASPLGIADDEWMVLESRLGRVRMKAKLNPSLDPRVVATQYGWWQGCQELGAPGYDPLSVAGANANLLISNDVIDPIGGSVPHRSQMCRVRKEA